MKFPERLSRERLFLLSKEDRAIYEAEWKDKPVLPESATYDFSTIFEQTEIDSVKENSYVMEQIDYLYQDLFMDIINEDEFGNVAKEIEKELLNEQLKSSQLLEYQGAEGWDHTKFLPNLSGLGKWFVAGLGLLGTGIALLASDIKNKIAMIKLKAFMNRLVEIIDQGINKRRSWLSKMFNWKNRGEHNTACFRFIQETADRNMALSVMQAAKRLGYFAPGQMTQIASGSNPQPGSGLAAFDDNVLSKINILIPEDDDADKKLKTLVKDN